MACPGPREMRASLFPKKYLAPITMLTLTHAARQFISNLLTQEDEGLVLRISASPEGPHIGTDRVRVGDNTFNSGNRCVLAVDQMVLRGIAGRTLDVEVADGRSSLVLVGE